MTPHERETILQGAASAMLRETGAIRPNHYVRTVRYPQPPLILAEREDNLHLVRRPEIDMSADEAIVAFAQAIEALLKDRTTELFHAVGGPASKMIRRFSALPSQVVALLWYLAGAENAALEYDDRKCMLVAPGITVGISGGTVQSPFITQYVGEVNPVSVLIDGGEHCRSTEPLFIAAYGMARRRRPHVAEGMAVLYQATTPQSFKRYVAGAQQMLESQCRKLEAEVLEGKDPVMRAYRTLVPRWMQQSEFTRTFGPLETRDMEPDTVRRSVLFNKLAMQDFWRA